jgi:hypothetical protein
VPLLHDCRTSGMGENRGHLRSDSATLRFARWLHELGQRLHVGLQ